MVTTPPPLTTTAGAPFGLITFPPRTLTGNIESSIYSTVTVALLGVSGSTVALSGSLTTTASQGAAAFTGLVLDTAGTAYKLQASGGGLITTTNAFNVTPAAAVELAVTVPPPGTMTAGAPFGLTVTFDDAFGNLATSFNGNVNVALATGSGGVTLSGPTRRHGCPGRGCLYRPGDRHGRH